LLLYLGDVDIATDIAGDAQQNCFRLQVGSAAILFVDELAVNVLQESSAGISHSTGGIIRWKVHSSFYKI
jgi:hypothetical protein